jgi:hypothetical protein
MDEHELGFECYRLGQQSRLVACRRDNVTADTAGRIRIFPLDLSELLHDVADSG